MSQRLVINNIIDGKVVNAMYYHWSARTGPALEEIMVLREDIIAFYHHNILDTNKPIENFNQACLKASSGISGAHGDSWKYANKNFGYDKQTVTQTEGIIAFTKEDMDDFTDWSDGTVWIHWKLDHNKNIDIENSTFNFTQLVTQYSEDKFYKHSDDFGFLSDTEIQRLKNYPANIELENMPVEDAEWYMGTLPEYWYNSRDNHFYAKIII